MTISARVHAGRLGRRLCYSHHIMSGTKRKYIMQWAVELGLRGFSKIGYPGVIVVEGSEDCCQEYVSRLQRLRWKHFVCRGEEVIEVPKGKTLEDLVCLPPQFLETTDMGFAGRYCTDAGLGDLFRTCMKIYK
eukprot:GHVO01044645.1.p1 GENE.GHVO01044645.1~~GHVO01044645.1.p1  ORF type:complete len:133 (+),score=13.60 GHVO01044645.1:37-435(+)